LHYPISMSGAWGAQDAPHAQDAHQARGLRKINDRGGRGRIDKAHCDRALSLSRSLTVTGQEEGEGADQEAGSVSRESAHYHRDQPAVKALETLLGHDVLGHRQHSRVDPGRCHLPRHHVMHETPRGKCGGGAHMVSSVIVVQVLSSVVRKCCPRWCRSASSCHHVQIDVQQFRAGDLISRLDRVDREHGAPVGNPR
jgi:hypothetical protein